MRFFFKLVLSSILILPPNPHFSKEVQALIREHLNVDVNDLDFEDKNGNSLLSSIKLNLTNAKLFGLAIASRLMEKEEFADWTLLPLMSENVVTLIKGCFNCYC